MVKDKEKVSWIDNKKIFSFSILFLLLAAILNFKFPHSYPLGEKIFTAINLPTRSSNGFHYVGILVTIMMLAAFFFIVNSVNKYHMRAVIVSFLIVSFVPLMLISLYQKTFATGIYAVHYSSLDNYCEFEMVEEKVLQGNCELDFTNHSNKDVQFTIEFYEEIRSKDDLPVVSLMNADAPYEVKLSKKENKRVHIKTNIDVSNMERYIEGGNATGINIIMKSNGKSREM